MAETVATGGTKTFHYEKDHTPKLKAEEKKEISNAYEKYDERKKQEN